MRVIPAVAILAALLCAAATFRAERADQARADEQLARGAPLEAFDSYGALADSEPLFLDRRSLLMQRETAATKALPEVLASHGFPRAHQLVTAILGGVESGYEGEARAVEADLPLRHAAWAGQLLSDGRLEDAIRECELVRATYNNVDARALVGPVEARARMAVADRALAEGDPGTALRTAALIDSEAPFPVRSRASLLAEQATALGARRRVETRDYAGLLRWLAASRETVGDRADMRAQVEIVFADFATRVFQLPARVPGTIDVDDPPAPIAVGSSSPGTARITIENRTGRWMTVLLKGPRDYRLTIPPGASRTLTVRPGEYGQAAHAGSALVPYLGVVQLAAEAYHQAFIVVRVPDEERPRPDTPRQPVVATPTLRADASSLPGEPVAGPALR